MITVSEYWVLAVIGFSLGGGFLIYLLIGDSREAKRKAKEEAYRKMREDAALQREGVWPPPPTGSA